MEGRSLRRITDWFAAATPSGPVGRGPARAAAFVALAAVGVLTSLSVLGAPAAAPGSDWAWMPIGTALQVALFATVVLLATGGRSPAARGVTALLLVLTATALAVNIALAPWVGGPGRPTGALADWLPHGQTAALHFLLAVALASTFRPGRFLDPLRTLGLCLAVLSPIISLAGHAFVGGGYAAIPGIVPMNAIAAVSTLVTAFAVATMAPDRWPMDVLIRKPSDRVLVGHMLPLIVLVPIVGPIVITTVRALGAGSELTAALGTLLPGAIVVLLLLVALRDHRTLTAALEARDRQLLAVIDGLPVAVMLRAQDGRLLHLNPGGERYVERLGVDVSAVSSGPSSLLEHVEVIDEDGNPYVPAALPVVSALRDTTDQVATLGYTLPEGGYAWYSVRAAPIPLSDGTVGAVVTLDDVTERQSARHRIAVAERSLRLTFEHAPIGVAVIAPDGRVLKVNAALCSLLGYDAATLLEDGLQAATDPAERAENLELLAAWRSGREERSIVDRRFRHAAGHWIHTQLSVALVRDDDGTPLHLIVQVVDLTEHRALERELRTAAVQDPLTGLANRRALAEQLTAAQQRQRRDGGDIGLLYLDLDGFKDVNDRHGHDAGDRVLVETGRRLREVTRETDTVCRMGGDEFVVLCTPIDGQSGLQELIDRIAALPPLTLDTHDLAVRVNDSVGGVLVEPQEDLDLALRRADAAMYAVKHGKTRGIAPVPQAS